MGIDPNIILGIRPAQFKVADPMESAQKAMSLQALMGQQDLHDMQLRQGRQAEEDDRILRQAYAGDPATLPQRLIAAGPKGYAAAAGIKKQELEEKAKLGDINKTRAETMAKLLGFQKDGASAVMANPSAETALAAVDQFERMASSFGMPELGQQAAQQRAAIQAAGGDPEKLKRLAAGWALAADKFLPKFEQRDLAGSVQSLSVDPITAQPTVTGSVPKNDPNKPFTIGPTGAPVAQQAYQDYEIKKAGAGAARNSVTVNTAEKPLLTQLGEGVGKQIIADHDQARSAVQTLNNARQIERSLGNVITGPGANARVTLAQIGQTLGISGANATEQLVNTRNVMQGLARQELAAAGQMKGQGQITESERGILRRAEAGDISDMTVPELRTFLSAIRKTANYKIKIHETNVERVKKNPNAAAIVDYLKVDVPEDVAEPPAASGLRVPRPAPPPPAGFKPL